MATAPPPAMTFTRIAAECGVYEYEVRTEVKRLGITTQRVGPARVVLPGDWPRLQRAIRQLQRANEAAVASGPPAPEHASNK